MQLGTHSEDSQSRLRGGRQRVIDRFDEGGEIVWCVVVGKKDFVVRVVEDFRNAIEGDGGAFVQVVSVRIVSPVMDDRNHWLWDCLDRPKSIAHGARTSGY